jgi:hypothetical protein
MLQDDACPHVASTVCNIVCSVHWKMLDHPHTAQTCHHVTAMCSEP